MFAEKMAEFMVENGFSVLELCRFMRSKRADLLHDEMHKLRVTGRPRKRLLNLPIKLQSPKYPQNAWAVCYAIQPKA